MGRRVHRGKASALWLLLAATSACTSDSAIVELDWNFVDHDGEPIFPGGSIINNRDTCALDGVGATGLTTYALIVSLVIEDTRCLADFEDMPMDDPAACEVARESFDCDRARGAVTGVPVSDAPYLMSVEVFADPAGDEEPFLVDPTCIAVPGPRTRKVQSGRITDLAVYQLVAHGIKLDDAEAGQLDLPGCRASDGAPPP